MFIIIKYPLLGGVLLLTYCLLDGIDGLLVRYLKIESKAGSLIDIMTDQIAVIVLPILSVLYFDTNFVFAYLFGMFYIIEIFLLTILNSLNIKFGFVFRVKYFYYFLFFLSAYFGRDFLLWFHIVFGIYYLIHSFILYKILSVSIIFYSK
ncbi:hypothetical protein F1B92_07240 [Campylobacter sp. FMV-PI01]|uniref:CDP-alcohol phosphatidyltransferase family protein n=1 Tax=Campylobacter portucalensis TaxID=2608384 RepID=A0A6L5WKL0_9BACT|nr:hypothetical protein [Campylobacter portucalensis]